jgi:hypothetical protein
LFPKLGRQASDYTLVFCLRPDHKFINTSSLPVLRGIYLEAITYSEKNDSRVYSFISIDEATGVVVKSQIENRNGKIFMRSKRRIADLSY